MKKLALLVAIVLAFSFSALAQGYGQSTSGSQSTGSSSAQESKQGTESTTETKAHKHKKGAASGEAGEASGAATAGGKQHQLTGCLEKSASGAGYTLTNRKYKNGVEVKSSEDLSAHVGHKVKLSGDWEQPGTSFNATKMTHISDTCTAGAAGAKAGGKKGKS